MLKKILNFKISKKALEWSLLTGLLCSVFLSFADFNGSCEDLRHNVLRLHIIANSDSAEDQELKLKIRDRILETSGDIFSDDSDIKSAVKTAEGYLDSFKETANRVIAENGFDYTVSVTLGDSYFGTREYDDFTLPAGEYESLIIKIGEAKGKNWWCVIFPQVCIPAAGKSGLSQSVSSSGTRVAENPENYVLRFKTVEIYEKIRHLLKK